jgi:tRNA (guanine37-N1)-methyltransferase
VPGVLLSGNHAQIKALRREQSLALTTRERSDLIERARIQGRLSAADEAFLLSLSKSTLT